MDTGASDKLLRLWVKISEVVGEQVMPNGISRECTYEIFQNCEGKLSLNCKNNGFVSIQANACLFTPELADYSQVSGD